MKTMSKSEEKLTPFEKQLVEMVEQAIALSVVEPQTKTADFVKERQDKLFQVFFNDVLSKMDDAAETFARFYDQGTCDGIAQECFKFGVTWVINLLNKSEDKV